MEEENGNIRQLDADGISVTIKNKMKRKEIQHRLLKIAFDNDLFFHEVEDVYNYETKKLYKREYLKDFQPDLDLADKRAYEIVKRYFKK